IIDKHDYQSYQAAADFINNQYDICVIQHEYGIFGGESGAHILGLCRRLHIPLASNFHTISPKPSDRERTILFQLGLMSHSITVMTDWAVNILQCVYKLSPEKIRVIQDRKSTRLNSSHVKISYAVFCLKKKIQKNNS